MRTSLTSCARLLAPSLLVAGLTFAACGDGTGGATGGGDDDDASGASSAGGGSQGGAGGGTGAMGGTGATGGAGCTSDADCTIDPAKPKCNLGTGDCVGCLLEDPCDPGEYCEPTTFTCEPGCTDDDDCAGGMNLACDTMSNNCVGCNVSTDCPQGTICVNQTCVDGCDQTQPCTAGDTCCGTPIGVCEDLAIDVTNCGSCGNACPDLANAAEICVGSQCQMGACEGAFEDCNGQAADGCEQNTLQDGPCVCMPGATQSCYQGAPGTVNVGPCIAGLQTCDADGLGWGACQGEVVPIAEICADGIDQNCDGTVDNGGDADADGWTICNGDCCDTVGPNCPAPGLVNPGALEVLNNNVDDDCDPASSDVVAPASCSASQKFSGVIGDDMAKAMDLCQFTTANPPLPQKKWGVITAQQLLSNGNAPNVTQTANIQNFMHAVMQNYGTNPNVTPKKGPTMAGISSGRMRDQNDAGFQNGDGAANAMGITNVCPPAYVAANGGNLPSSQGCSGNCPVLTSCLDGTEVRLTIRTPTNAQAFSYQFKFHSYEYPEWVCDIYNDFYLALLTTVAPGIPADKNISFDSLGNAFSVNNGFFDVCQVSALTCATCPAGNAELTGTGMFPNLGGGSVWLTTDAPIVPGETMILELMEFDVGDQFWDTNILLDNFTWSLTPVILGTHQ